MAIARALSASAAVVLCGIAVLATGPARGQDYPARPMTLIVPLAPLMYRMARPRCTPFNGLSPMSWILLPVLGITGVARAWLVVQTVGAVVLLARERMNRAA